MKRVTLATFALALGLSVSGSALAQHRPEPPPVPQPNPYPMQAAAFRARIDKLVDQLHAACNRLSTCPRPYVESGISQLKLRTLEACRDGIVTKDEGEWVMRARPTVPMPPDPHPHGE